MPHPSFLFTSSALAVACLLVTATLQAQTQGPVQNPAPAGQAALPGAPRPGEPVLLNFNNADIDAVARAIGVMTGRTMVIDPRVKGTLTLTTERAIAPLAAYNQFLATIRLQGFTVVESGGLYKVVPEADAKLQGGTVSVGPVSGAGSQLQTQIFQLNFENANNLVPVLRPLISPNNTINVNPGNNSLVITDYADNLQRMARIVAALDVSNASDVEVLPLQHSVASDMQPLIAKLLDASGTAAPAGAGAGQTDTSFRTTLIAEPRSNSLILRAANPARVALVKSLVKKLDQPPRGGNGAAGNIYVVHLRNADATKLAITLRAAMAAEGRNSAAGTQAGGVTGAPLATGTATSTAGFAGSISTTGATGATSGPSLNQNANQPSTGGQIQADPSTNSLIITAPEPQYRQLRAVIEMLDSRRPQVLVESLIIEVSSNKAAEFGIQLQGALGKMALGTNFGTGAKNLATLASNIALGSTSTAISSGFNLGIAQKIGGTYVLSTLGRLLDTTGTGNVLSTPNLLTLDNEEAKIVVGKNVPFVTGTYAATGASTSTVNPFQTIERKDVGLTLRVKPQINENGMVKMAIYQEVSNVDAATLTNTNGPTTNKRSIESNVLVDDGAIVVLGGLLEDTFAGNEEKVPLLGDIPVFGNLFRSETRSRVKTNLMVFLRPTVIRDADASDALAASRYDMMRVEQDGVAPLPKTMMPNVPAANLMAPLGTAVPANRTGAQQPVVPPLGIEPALLQSTRPAP